MKMLTLIWNHENLPWPSWFKTAKLENWRKAFQWKPVISQHVRWKLGSISQNCYFEYVPICKLHRSSLTNLNGNLRPNNLPDPKYPINNWSVASIKKNGPSWKCRCYACCCVVAVSSRRWISGRCLSSLWGKSFGSEFFLRCSAFNEELVVAGFGQGSLNGAPYFWGIK